MIPLVSLSQTAEFQSAARSRAVPAVKPETRRALGVHSARSPSERSRPRSHAFLRFSKRPPAGNEGLTIAILSTGFRARGRIGLLIACRRRRKQHGIQTKRVMPKYQD